MVELVDDINTDVNVLGCSTKGDYYTTALNIAIETNEYIVQLLLQRLDLKFSNMPLIYTCVHGSFQSLVYLADDERADFNETTIDENGLLMSCALIEKNDSFAKFNYLKKKCKIRRMDKWEIILHDEIVG